MTPATAGNAIGSTMSVNDIAPSSASNARMYSPSAGTVISRRTRTFVSSRYSISMRQRSARCSYAIGPPHAQRVEVSGRHDVARDDLGREQHAPDRVIPGREREHVRVDAGPDRTARPSRPRCSRRAPRSAGTLTRAHAPRQILSWSTAISALPRRGSGPPRTCRSVRCSCSRSRGRSRSEARARGYAPPARSRMRCCRSRRTLFFMSAANIRSLKRVASACAMRSTRHST